MPTTITQLTALPLPADLPNNHRIAPVELTAYVVRARLIEFKRESDDDDFYLVIAESRRSRQDHDRRDPAPSYSKAEALLAPPRREFVDLFGSVWLSWSWLHALNSADLDKLVDVGFFVFDHDQKGIAPNARATSVLRIRQTEWLRDEVTGRRLSPTL